MAKCGWDKSNSLFLGVWTEALPNNSRLGRGETVTKCLKNMAVVFQFYRAFYKAFDFNIIQGVTSSGLITEA